MSAETTPPTPDPVELAIRNAPEIQVYSFIDDTRREDLKKFLDEGLPEDEACVLAGFPREEIAYLKSTNADFNAWIEKEVIKFKQKHLKRVGDTSNPKTSQWLLEKRFPKEYSGARQAAPESNGDMVTAIIRTIQRTDNGPLTNSLSSITIQNKKEKTLDDGAGRPVIREANAKFGGANIL